jgi:Cdc6-like AAA superfamily ATPase
VLVIGGIVEEKLPLLLLMGVIMDQEEVLQRLKAVGRAFTPSSPVQERDLFAGRDDQLRTLVITEGQVGQHAVIYGVRGAGKTSLARVAQAIIDPNPQPYYVCHSGDTFDSIWRGLLATVVLTKPMPSIGFNASPKTTPITAAQLLFPTDTTIDPQAVAQGLRLLSQHMRLTAVIDEFDRPTEPALRVKMADTVKILADLALPVTVVLVGVADSVGGLLREHESIQRSLIQVEMPPMTEAELSAIVQRGMASAGLTYADRFGREVVALSLGLPHYTHLICLHAATFAVSAGRTHVGMPDLESALRQALEDASQSVRERYHAATYSNRETLYKAVLLACAMCPRDELNSFGAPEVREQLRQVTGQSYEIPAFATHLTDFSGNGPRGGVLKRIGTTRRFRYQFRDPLMPTYVLMRGRVDREQST